MRVTETKGYGMFSKLIGEVLYWMTHGLKVTRVMSCIDLGLLYKCVFGWLNNGVNVDLSHLLLTP